MSRQDEESWERLERYEDDDPKPLTDAEIEGLEEQERETQRDAERWRQGQPDADQPQPNGTGGQP